MPTTFAHCKAGDEPAHAGIDVVLLDGTAARLRPARAEDRDALRTFYQRLSPESRYLRFFGKPNVDDIVDDFFVAVDSRSAFALLAEIDRQVVAVGQYFVIPESPTHLTSRTPREGRQDARNRDV